MGRPNRYTAKPSHYSGGTNRGTDGGLIVGRDARSVHVDSDDAPSLIDAHWTVLRGELAAHVPVMRMAAAVLCRL